MSRVFAALALACLTAAPAGAMTRARSPAAADHYRDGKQRYAARDYAAALREFQESYRLDPTPAMWINIGQCLRALGRDTEAVAAYERFLEVPGGNPRLRDEVFQALDALRAPKLPHPPPPVRDGYTAEHYYRGKLAYSAGDFQRALDEFHLAYRRGPAPGLLVNIGNALRKLDRPAQAIAAYQTFLDQAGGSKQLRLQVFEALDAVRSDLDDRMFKLAEAAALFRRYLDSGRGTPEVRVVMRGTLEQTLDALVRLDREAGGRYLVDPGTGAVARRY